MWKTETRKYKATYDNETWLDKQSVVRDDGLSIMLIGEGPERDFYFVYADRDRSFKFRAHRLRTDVANFVLSSEWHVNLGAGLNRLPPQHVPTFAEARQIADNIQEGLLAWGWYEESQQTTARSVKFRVQSWRKWSPSLGWGE